MEMKYKLLVVHKASLPKGLIKYESGTQQVVYFCSGLFIQLPHSKYQKGALQSVLCLKTLFLTLKVVLILFKRCHDCTTDNF